MILFFAVQLSFLFNSEFLLLNSFYQRLSTQFFYLSNHNCNFVLN